MSAADARARVAAFKAELVTQIRLLQMAGTVAAYDAESFAESFIWAVQSGQAFTIGPASKAACQAIGIRGTDARIKAALRAHLKPEP